MDSNDNFAFLLPFILLTFGVTFLAVSRYDRRGARSWGIGYGLAGIGFISIAPIPWVPFAVQALGSDVLFIGAFYFYGQALLERFDRPLRTVIRLAFCGVALAVNAHAVLVAESLNLNILTNDLACAVLLGGPLLLSLTRPKHWLDVALLCLAGVVVTEMIVRNLILLAVQRMPDGLDAFASSSYAFFMQAGAGVIGLLFALTGLAAVARDMLAGYRDAAERDPLTGLLNRRGFEHAIPLAADGGIPAGAVIICDIDHFKRINDTYGHAAGDQVLVALADLLRKHLPKQAIAARFGGEEFVAFLPAYSLPEAGIFANMLRLALAARNWRDVNVHQQITASFGGATTRSADLSLQQAIARADIGLYAAKAAGRNQVILEEAKRSAEPMVLRAFPAKSAK